MSDNFVSAYVSRHIAERYAKDIERYHRGLGPLFIPLRQLAYKLEKIAANRNCPKAKKSGLLADAHAAREEADRLTREAGIPMKFGISSAGDIRGTTVQK